MCVRREWDSFVTRCLKTERGIRAGQAKLTLSLPAGSGLSTVGGITGDQRGHSFIHSFIQSVSQCVRSRTVTLHVQVNQDSRGNPEVTVIVAAMQRGSGYFLNENF